MTLCSQYISSSDGEMCHLILKWSALDKARLDALLVQILCHWLGALLGHFVTEPFHLSLSEILQPDRFYKIKKKIIWSCIELLFVIAQIRDIKCDTGTNWLGIRTIWGPFGTLCVFFFFFFFWLPWPFHFALWHFCRLYMSSCFKIQCS